MNRKPALVGLTGGIGSGKSTAAAMFAALGVPVLDLDDVGHRLLDHDDCRRALVRAFGSDVLRADGSLDREALAQAAFATEAQTRRLNAIMHPRIWRAMDAWAATQRTPWALVEASVLIESGGVARMDAVIVVLARAEIRLARVHQARGWSKARIRQVMERQCGDEERRRVADFVLDNNGDIEALRRQVVKVHERLTTRFGAAAIDKSAAGE